MSSSAKWSQGIGNGLLLSINYMHLMGFSLENGLKDQNQGPKWVSVIIVADTSPIGTIAQEKQIQCAWFQVGSDFNTYSLDSLSKFAQSYLFNFFFQTFGDFGITRKLIFFS